MTKDKAALFAALHPLVAERQDAKAESHSWLPRWSDVPDRVIDRAFAADRALLRWFDENADLFRAECICYPGECPQGCEPACASCNGAAESSRSSDRCPLCAGLGLDGTRDEWGFGRPCPKCKGSGVVE